MLPAINTSHVHLHLKAVNTLNRIKFQVKKLPLSLYQIYCPSLLSSRTIEMTFFLLQRNSSFKINITLVANVKYPGSFFFRYVYTNLYALHHLQQRLKVTIYHNKFHKKRGKAINSLLHEIRFGKQSTCLLQCTYT